MLAAPIVESSPRDRAALDVTGPLDGRRMTVAVKPGVILIVADCNVTDDALLLRLSPQSKITDAHVRDAITIDLALGDPVFDQTFHLEAAPTETVRAMFDTRTRTFLLTHPRCHVSLKDRELQYHFEALSTMELETALPEVAYAAAQAERAVKDAAADIARPTDRDGYRDTPRATGDTALARVQPTTHAARELRRLREIRDRGHFFGTTLAVTGTTYAATIIAYGLPWLLLILTPLVVIFGGIALYFVLCVLTEATGMAKMYRRHRVRRLDEPH